VLAELVVEADGEELLRLADMVEDDVAERVVLEAGDIVEEVVES